MSNTQSCRKMGSMSCAQEKRFDSLDAAVTELENKIEDFERLNSQLQTDGLVRSLKKKIDILIQAIGENETKYEQFSPKPATNVPLYNNPLPSNGIMPKSIIFSNPGSAPGGNLVVQPPNDIYEQPVSLKEQFKEKATIIEEKIMRGTDEVQVNELEQDFNTLTTEFDKFLSQDRDYPNAKIRMHSLIENKKKILRQGNSGHQQSGFTAAGGSRNKLKVRTRRRKVKKVNKKNSKKKGSLKKKSKKNKNKNIKKNNLNVN
jgi:hypothetical protein